LGRGLCQRVWALGIQGMTVKLLEGPPQLASSCPWWHLGLTCKLHHGCSSLCLICSWSNEGTTVNGAVPLVVAPWWGSAVLVGGLVWIGLDWMVGRLVWRLARESTESDRAEGSSYIHTRTRAGVHDNYLLRLGTMGMPLAPAAVLE